MRMPGLALAIGCLVVSVAVLSVGLASAHGGREVYAQEAGPYLVQAFARELSAQDGGYVDYTLSLREAGTRHPIDNADVKVAAETPDGRVGPRQANASTNVYSVLLPFRNSGEWTMQVSIEGSLGSASYQHLMTASLNTFSVSRDKPAVGWWIAPAAVVLAAGIGALYFGRRFRRRSQPTPEANPADMSNPAGPRIANSRIARRDRPR